ncbi:MAG: hypothetical protein CMC08_01915 [Flavobacteriaceae bacterium]|nr:hypothetical protein [Flavobacteriaceae bacterium]
MFPYKVSPRVATITGGTRKYYATALKQGGIEGDALVALLSQRTRLAEADTLKLLLYLSELVAERMLEGSTVTLPNLGILRPTLSSRGVARPSDFRTKDITRVNVNFLPNRKLKARLQLAHFRRVD